MSRAGKVPRVAFTDELHRDIREITSRDGYRDFDKLTEIVDEYHRQADKEVKAKGFPAYYDGDLTPVEYTDDNRLKLLGDLRVLDPDAVRVVRSKVTRPREEKIKFGDLKPGRKQGRGKLRR